MSSTAQDVTRSLSRRLGICLLARLWLFAEGRNSRVPIGDFVLEYILWRHVGARTEDLPARSSLLVVFKARSRYASGKMAMWLLDILWLLPPIVLPAMVRSASKFLHHRHWPRAAATGCLLLLHLRLPRRTQWREAWRCVVIDSVLQIIISSALAPTYSVRNLGRRLVGARVAGACGRVLHYVVYERNPLMQFFYCGILGFEAVTVSTEILPTLPTRYLSSNHQ